MFRKLGLLAVLVVLATLAIGCTPGYVGGNYFDSGSANAAIGVTGNLAIQNSFLGFLFGESGLFVIVVIALLLLAAGFGLISGGGGRQA